MLIKILIIFVFLALASACDDAASRLDAEARVCKRALEIGELELAEKHCQLAVGDPADDVLAPQVRSERLYKLASIKRQLTKYNEAADLLGQSLTLEQTLSGSASPQVARRHLEMSLILAGQGQWQDGALLLEQTVPVADQLDDDEKRTLANILKRYAAQLQKSRQTEQAARLLAAAASLNKEPTTPR